MTDFNTALSLSTVLNIGYMSSISGSSFTRNIACEPDFRPTGSFCVNVSWLEQQIMSGQNFHIINNRTSAFEQKIEVIKIAFAMSEEDIAQSIGVTRKTLFNWKQQNPTPNKEKVQSVFELYVLAKNWLDAQFPSSPIDLSTPVLAGQSIKDMLRDPKLNSEKILFAGNRLAHQSFDEVDLF